MSLHRVLFTGAFLALSSATVFGQNITFSQADRTLPYNVNLAHGVDVNGDGATDFLFDPTASKNLYSLVSDGHGDFAGQTISTIYCPSAVLGFGDFRRIGKEDLLVGSSLYGVTCGGAPEYTAAAIYSNNGSGAFTLNKKATGVVLGAVVADFNGDGKLDVVTLNNSDSSHPTQTINLYYGNGGGAFAGPYLIAKPTGEVEIDQGTYDYRSGVNLMTGDYDGDGCADAAWLDFSYDPSSGNGIPSTSQIKIAYGNCHGSFTVKTVYTSKTQALNYLVTADMNRDGVSDIVANYQNFISYTGGNAIFYGQKARTVTSKLIEDPYVGTGIVQVGDFNGDGFPDIAYLSSDGQFPYGSDSDEVKILAGNAAQSFSNVTIYPLPHISVRSLLAGDFNHDGKEDLAFLYSSYEEQKNNVFSILTNTTQFPNGTCVAPSSPGVKVCAPGNGSSVNSPVQVQAASTITGTLARMELWVDGVKKYTETSSKTLNTSISLAAGSHRFGVFAVNTAGTKWEGVANATVK
jgi:hypothetical protein